MTTETLYFVIATVLLASVSVRGAEPPRSAGTVATASPEAKTAERDQLWKRVQGFSKTTRAATSVATAEKLLALDRKLYGDQSEPVAETLIILAGMHVRRDEFPLARKRAQEALAINKSLYGEGHWRTTDSQWALSDVDRWEKMTSEDRDALRQAEDNYHNIAILLNKKNYPEALAFAKRAIEAREPLLGAEHPSTVDCLLRLAGIHKVQKEYEQALPLYQRATAICEKSLGPSHPATGNTVRERAAFHELRKEYAQAIPLYERAFAIRGETLGAEHPSTVDLLEILASNYGKQGQREHAIQLFQRALSLREKILGTDNPKLVVTLERLSAMYRHDTLDRAALAASLAVSQRSLALRDKSPGPEAPTTVAAVSRLALLAEGANDWKAAEALHARNLAWIKKNRETGHWEIIDAELALKYAILQQSFAAEQQAELARADQIDRDTMRQLDYQGRYAELIPQQVEACEIRKRLLGEHHPRVALALSNLAGLYGRVTDFAHAEPLWSQTRDIYRETLGEYHPVYARTVQQLGGIYYSLRDYPQAERLLIESRNIRKVVFGKNHSEYGASLENLAVLYLFMGDYDRAEPLLRETIEIYGKTLGKGHPDYAQTTVMLAQLYRKKGDFARAEPLYRQAIDTDRAVYGASHHHYAGRLASLGSLYVRMGDYARAEPLLLQARDIDRATLGESHLDYAGILNQLAGLYLAQDDYDRCLPLYVQSKEIVRQVFGEHHPSYAKTINYLAKAYYRQGKYAQAQPLVAQALQIASEQVRLASAIQSERQQLRMNDYVRFYLDDYLSCAARSRTDAESTYAALLSWKGAILARQRCLRLARASSDPQVKDLFEQLQATATQLSKLALDIPDADGREAWRRELAELTERKEALEAKLSGINAEYDRLRTESRLTPRQLQALLPADAVLVDLLEYGHLERPDDNSGSVARQRRIVAFVIRHQDPVVMIDLGPAKPINEVLTAWRRVYGTASAQGRSDPGTDLRTLLWAPLEAHVGNARTVLISPDEALATIPWGALPGKELGTRLMEERALAVIPVPQMLPDLLETKTALPSEASLLLVGQVNYGASPGASGLLASSRSAPRGTNEHFSLLKGWQPLEGTRPETIAVRELFEHRYPQQLAQSLQEEQATEQQFRRRAPQSRFLHIATHGYFAPPELRSALFESSRGAQQRADDLFGERDVAGYHPGLLSGIVLAGANLPPQANQDDGILTALEVAELDLSGVELATLSACETGLGESAGGEGLLGLQRAFQVAGARTTVASLWQVPDDATRTLMIEFYDNLWTKKLSKLEALRQAQLTMLREYDPRAKSVRGRGLKLAEGHPLDSQTNRLPPYYWAAFVLSGDWR